MIQSHISVQEPTNESCSRSVQEVQMSKVSRYLVHQVVFVAGDYSSCAGIWQSAQAVRT